MFEPSQSRKTAALKASKCVCFFYNVGDNMEKYMKIAIIEAKKAEKNGDVPIGAVIVKDNKIIAKAHNKKENKNIATYHAEILAINKACKKLHTWRLNDCTLYSTMEPCTMCCGAIIQSRIGKIVYSIPNENFGGINMIFNSDISGYKPEIISEICSEECLNIVQNFFKRKRK